MQKYIIEIPKVVITKQQALINLHKEKSNN